MQIPRKMQYWETTKLINIYEKKRNAIKESVKNLNFI